MVKKKKGWFYSAVSHKGNTPPSWAPEDKLNHERFWSHKMFYYLLHIAWSLNEV